MFLAVWFVLLVGVGASLLARHLFPFRAPRATTGLGTALAALRAPGDERWLAVHVLYAGCRCSARVADHLSNTLRDPRWSEIVLWIGDDTPAELAARFDVRVLTPEGLSALGIDAAPMMVLLDPEGHVHYAGGYTERKQGPAIDERKLLDEARANAWVAPLPVYGCAVSAHLKNETSLLPTL